MPQWKEFVEWALEQAEGLGGRKALRRRWAGLRKLAREAAAKIPPKEIESLLGKPFDALDPEQNDLKALVAYAIGKGTIKEAKSLQSVLDSDTRADPLYFLAHHSGKTFGEKYAPLFAEFWLVSDGDGWVKKKSKDLYDVGWKPQELKGKEIRIELKASSEQPAYLFQQIRHSTLSGGKVADYDLLLCLGVSAGSLEWWAIRTKDLDELAENGNTPASRIVITRHHGKRRPIWNAEHGFTDEGWFRADPRARELLKDYACANSEQLRTKVLACF